MNAYAQPTVPASTHPPTGTFRAAVQSAGIGESKDVPHLSEAVIDKYVTDLKQLGLLPVD